MNFEAISKNDIIRRFKALQDAPRKDQQAEIELISQLTASTKEEVERMLNFAGLKVKKAGGRPPKAENIREEQPKVDKIEEIEPEVEEVQEAPEEKEELKTVYTIDRADLIALIQIAKEKAYEKIEKTAEEIKMLQEKIEKLKEEARILDEQAAMMIDADEVKVAE